MESTATLFDLKKEEDSFEEEKVREHLNDINRKGSLLPPIASSEKRDKFIVHEIIDEQTLRDNHDLSRTAAFSIA
jgi:hypothetical protein